MHLNKLLFTLSFFVLFLSCSDSGKGGEGPEGGKEVKPNIEIAVPEVVLPEITEGSSSSVKANFKTSAPWSIHLSNTRSVPTWFTVAPLSGAAGEAEISINITQDNSLYEDRSGYIVIQVGSITKTITVSQKKKEAIITSKDRYDVTPDGGVFSVDLKSNVAYEVIVPEDFKDWLTHKKVKSKAAGLTSTSEHFEVAEGAANNNREGIIIFKSGILADTVKVFQAMKKNLTLNKEQVHVSYHGAENIEVEVRTNVRYEVIVSDSVKSWISVIEPENRAQRVDRFYLQVAKNTSYSNRRAEITIKDLESDLSTILTILQAQENAIILSAKHVDVVHSGGIIEAEIQSNIGYQVKILDDAKWIKQLPTARALKREIVKFSVDSIEENTDREGRVVFINTESNVSDTLVISQLAEKMLFLEKKEYHFQASSYDFQVPINKKSSDIVLNIIIPDDIDWIVFNPNRASIEEYYSFQIKENANFYDRFGQVIFKDRNSELSDTLTIYQAEKKAVMLSQNQFNVESDGTTINVQLNTNVDYEIFMPSDVDWVKQEIARSLNTYDLSFRIDENTSTKARETEIVFRDASYTLSDRLKISQKGHVTPGVYHLDGESLFDVIDRQALRDTITYIKVTGYMRDADFVAFRSFNLPKLTSIDISEAVLISKGLPSSAFSNENLVSVKYPLDIESIGEAAFSDCKKLKGDLVIPDKVTHIGAYAFQGCTGLTSIDLTNVKIIGKAALSLCTGLTSVDFKDVETVEQSAFWDCTNLASVDLKNVKTIGDQAFEGCTGLTSIDLKNVEELGSSAFAQCTSLTSVDTHAIKTIDATFYGCTNLTRIDMENVTEIGKKTFYQCPNLKTVNLGKGVIIREDAFNDCISLANINFDHVAKIERYAFKGCTGLEGKLRFTDYLTEIARGAFWQCTGITGLEIDAPAHIGDESFKDCTSLSSVSFKRIKAIGSNTFTNSPITGEVILPNSLASVGLNAFCNMLGITKFVFPSNLEIIGEFAFGGCENAEGEFPSFASTIAIGNWAFKNSPKLKVEGGIIVIPKELTWLGGESFEGTSIEGIRLPWDVPIPHPSWVNNPELGGQNETGRILDIGVPFYIPKNSSGNYVNWSLDAGEELHYDFIEYQ